MLRDYFSQKFCSITKTWKFTIYFKRGIFGFPENVLNKKENLYIFFSSCIYNGDHETDTLEANNINDFFPFCVLKDF